MPAKMAWLTAVVQLSIAPVFLGVLFLLCAVLGPGHAMLLAVALAGFCPQNVARAGVAPNRGATSTLATPASPTMPIYDRHSRRRVPTGHGLAAGL